MSVRTGALAGSLALIAAGAGGFLLRLHQEHPSAAKILATTFIVMLVVGCLLIAVCAGRRRPISFVGWGAIVLGLGALWSTTLLSDHTVGSSAFMLALGAILLLLAGLVLNVAAGVLGLMDRQGPAAPSAHS